MKVEIQQEVQSHIKCLYEEALPKETGGILFGYYSNDLETAQITDIYYNIPDSKKSYRSFIRGKKGFRQYSKKMWEKNKYYLGEWHSHPESVPYMSIQDKKQMLRIKQSENMKCPEPILLIIGEKNNGILLASYIFFGNEILFNELNI
jgi:integrative and conjugative element protein (TIGR02256 family)